MTVAEAIRQIDAEIGRFTQLESLVTSLLADKLTGSSWSEAVIKHGMEKRWMGYMRKVLDNHRSMTNKDWDRMCAMMDRPTLN